MIQSDLRIFDALHRQFRESNLPARAQELIHELPELEAYRKMSHAMAMLKPLSSANIKHVL